MKKELTKLTKLAYFRTSHLEAFLPHLKKASIHQSISRLIKKGEIIKLKKGFYTTKEYSEKHISEIEYFYYLAKNKSKKYTIAICKIYKFSKI